MLTWYNKLWTDSAEYKMWGNGIALPTALYCMQGIADALERAKDENQNVSHYCQSNVGKRMNVLGLFAKIKSIIKG